MVEDLNGGAVGSCLGGGPEDVGEGHADGPDRYVLSELVLVPHHHSERVLAELLVECRGVHRELEGAERVREDGLGVADCLHRGIGPYFARSAEEGVPVAHIDTRDLQALDLVDTMQQAQ